MPAFSDVSVSQSVSIHAALTMTHGQLASDLESEAGAIAACVARYTDTEKTKLSGIENAATADQTGAEVKALYEAEVDTNVFLDAEKTKLSAIAANADVTGSNPPQIHAASAHSDIERELFLESWDIEWPTAVHTYVGVLLDDATAEGVYYMGRMPSNYVSLVSISVLGEPAAGDTGSVVFDWAFQAGKEGGSYFGQANFSKANVVVAVDGYNMKLMNSGATPENFANVVAGSFFRIGVRRDGVHASDTLAGDWRMRGVVIKYIANE